MTTETNQTLNLTYAEMAAMKGFVPGDDAYPIPAPGVGELRSSIMKAVKLTLDTTERQARYVKAQEARGSGIGLVFADAFIRGMRDIGYKDPAWATAEHIDNSFQSGATVVDFRFGFAAGNASGAKPDQLAIIDNGAGMIPKMLSYAVRWGGTDRENDRAGFGRYGYGLPSAAVSLARRYAVYSKVAGDDWHVVVVDLDELANAAFDLNETERLLAPKAANPPPWLAGSGKNEHHLDVSRLDSGTVIVFEDIDRLRQMTGWITVASLEPKLLQRFGVIYRHWLGDKKIIVNGKVTEPVDPLFLMPNGRQHSETAVMAKKVYEHAFEMEASNGEKGVVRIRAALLPPNFQLVDATYFGRKGAKNNKRHAIMKEFNGLLICREARQIDCISPEWTKFQTYDYNIKIEIDFDPVLDEHFGITTAKQQIVVDDRMWEKLKQSGRESGGLQALLKDMRRQFETMQAELCALYGAQSVADEPRPSEQAMAEAEKFRVRRVHPTPAKVNSARQNLEEEVKKVTSETGHPPEQVRAAIEKSTSSQLWHVDFAAIDEGPFFIPKRMGTLQKRIVINTAHPFYKKVYDQADSIKSALEVLLFVLADGELDAEGEREHFYKNERQYWSTLLRHALDKLVDDETAANRASMAREQAEVAVSQGT